MMYKVIASFADLQDNRHVYKVGDKFPHDDAPVSAERLEELSTSKNRRGIPLIELVGPSETNDKATETVANEKVEEVSAEKPKRENEAKSTARKTSNRKGGQTNGNKSRGQRTKKNAD